MSGTVVAVVNYGASPFMSFVTDTPGSAYSAMVSEAVAHFGLPNPSYAVNVYFKYSVDTADFPAADFEWTVKNDADLKAAFVWFARAGLTAPKFRVHLDTPNPTAMPTVDPSPMPSVAPTVVPTMPPTPSPVPFTTCSAVFAQGGADGVYNLNQVGTTARQGYCVGGYTVIAKIGSNNNVGQWGYTGTGWSAGSLLGTTDLTLNDADAKYAAFDEFYFSTFRAQIVTAGNTIWDANTASGLPETAGTFFNTKQIIMSGAGTSSWTNSGMSPNDEYNPTYMGRQNYGWYGVNIHDTASSNKSYNYGCRWGFIFNEGGGDAASDANAGIGWMDIADNHSRVNSAASNNYRCCGNGATNGNANWFVIIMGKE